MASASENDQCDVKNCGKVATAQSPLNGNNLCTDHLRKDRRTAKGLKDDFLKKLKHLDKDIGKVESELEWIEAERGDVIAAFNKLIDRIDFWREAMLQRLETARVSVQTVLNDVKMAKECERLVEDTGNDLRRVVEKANGEALWLEDATRRSDQFNHGRNCGAGVRPNRLIGDVAAGVQQLQAKMDRHMTRVMRECRLEDKSIPVPVPNEHRGYLELTETITVTDFPYYLAACTNTTGYVVDANTRGVIRGEPRGELRDPLPDICIFVSFKPDRKQKHLQVAPLEGDKKYEVYCDLINPEGKTTGLHCDSDQQLLYLAKSRSVIIMDLSGQQRQQIDSNILQRQVFFKKGITGRDHYLVAMDRKVGAVLTIGGDDNGDLVVNRSTDIRNLEPENSKLRGPALHASKLLFADYMHGRVHRVCGISGSLISSIPSARSGAVREFKSPWQVVVDDRGLMVVSEFNGHTVRLMREDGKILQTLGTPGSDGNSKHEFSHPTGLVIAKWNGNSHLVVADTKNKRLCVFKML